MFEQTLPMGDSEYLDVFENSTNSKITLQNYLFKGMVEWNKNSSGVGQGGQN